MLKTFIYSTSGFFQLLFKFSSAQTAKIIQQRAGKFWQILVSFSSIKFHEKFTKY